MNMISTGAFLTEMDASSKQSTAEKFAAVWEKKNAKAARAGGVSLMALSLAACGSSSDDTTSTTSSSTTTTTTTTTTDAAQTIAMTKAIDFVTGGSGDDTIVADNTVDVQANAADEVDGGAGNDTFKLYFDATNAIALPVTVENVENLYINDTGTVINTEDFSIAALTDVTSIEIDAAATDGDLNADARFVLTVGAGQAVTLDGIKDGLDSDTANEEGEFEIGSAATVTSLDLTVDGVGHANTTGANTGDLDVDIAGTGVATLNATAVGSNYVGLINSGAALTTLNVSGAGTFDASGDAVATLTTVDASAATGSVKVNITGSTKDVTLTGGSGDDTFIVGADLDKYDTIDGGAGRDTVNITSATLTAATANDVIGANAMSNIEVLTTSATGTLNINATKFTSINDFGNSAAVTGTAVAASADARSDGATFTFASGDTFVVGANMTGGAGSAGASSTGMDGGHALTVAGSVDTGNDEVTILFAAGAATTMAGGSAADGSADGTGVGGAGLNASTVETINIVTNSAKDDVTFSGNAQGSASGTTAGDDIEVGANATINITGAGDVTLNDVGVVGTAADDITVDGSAMTGVLTVVTGAGNDVIKGGSKADTITAATGINTLTGGAGKDTFQFADDASKETTNITTITDFEVGAGKDIIKFTTAAGTFEALTAASKTALASATTLNAALEAVDGQLAEHEATVFTFGANSYVIYEEANDTDGYTEANYSVVVLEGITDVTSFDTTQIA